MAKQNLQLASSKAEMNKVRQILAEFAGVNFNVDQGVARHEDPPNKISLPQDMSLRQAHNALGDLAIADEQVESYIHRFKFRHEDGAYAVTQVMEKYFGSQGRGMAQVSFFGEIPPQKISVPISNNPKEDVTVPWGEIKFAPIEGSITLGVYRDPEFGILFMIEATCPKRMMPIAKAFCQMVDAELKEFSIYKGKAIYMARGNDSPDGTEIRFMDLGTHNDTIVYNEDVVGALTTEVWGPIQHRELLKSDGRKVNTRTLMHGPYGTGKSEAGLRTAQIATENETTFFNFNSGRGTLDELEQTVAMARLYSPSVVFVEDVDVYASKEDQNYQTRLSNLFDGVGSKGDEVMIVMTSNHAASFSKGMLRAGRIDALIEIGALNKQATQALIERVIGVERLDKDLDFDVIWEALEGFEPAFVRQTFDKAAKSALLRSGSRDYVLGTEDFVNAATLMRPQHDLHAQKENNSKVVTFDSMVVEAVAKTLRAVEWDGEDFNVPETETILAL